MSWLASSIEWQAFSNLLRTAIITTSRRQSKGPIGCRHGLLIFPSRSQRHPLQVQIICVGVSGLPACFSHDPYSLGSVRLDPQQLTTVLNGLGSTTLLRKNDPKVCMG